LESKNSYSFAEVYSFIGCSSCASTCVCLPEIVFTLLFRISIYFILFVLQKRLTSCRRLLIDTIYSLFQCHELLQTANMPAVISRACRAKVCLLVNRKVLGCIEKIHSNENDTLYETVSSESKKIPDLLESTILQTVTQEPRISCSTENLTISPRCLYRAILAISPAVAALGVSPRGVRQISSRLPSTTIGSWDNKTTCHNTVECSNNISIHVCTLKKFEMLEIFDALIYSDS
jgi:hypothetical protein